MLKLIPFKAEHATHFSTIDDRVASVYAAYGIGYTGIDNDGRIIFAAGILPKHDSVGDAWVVFTENVNRCKIAAIRTIINMMGIVIAEYGFKKVRAASVVGFGKASGLIEYLGFKRQRRDTISGHPFYVRST